MSMSEIVSPPTKVKRTRWPAAAMQARCTEAIKKNESTQQRSIRINQLNGSMRVLGPKKVGPLVHKVIYGVDDDEKKGKESSKSLLNRVLDATATHLNKSKSSNAEDRRVKWTNKQNLMVWFNNWESDLVQLGTAIIDPITGKVEEEQY